MIISGSKVLQGVAKVLVVAVGENSFYGRAMMVNKHDLKHTHILKRSIYS
jgi:Ca2+-transporting ATPase